MSKRMFEKDTVLSNPILEKKIKESIELTLRKIWQFSLSQKGNNRSSAKTDLLHSSWENLLKDSFGDFKDLFDKKFSLKVEKEDVASRKTDRISILDMYGLPFNVDMMLLNEKQDVHTVFLLKAPMTSINKNRFNMVGSLGGEILRFYGNNNNRDLELVFVNLTPKKTFTLSEDGVRKEDVNFIGLSYPAVTGHSVLNSMPIDESIKEKIKEVHIEYELKWAKPWEEIVTKQDLMEASQDGSFQVDVSSIDSLKKYLEHLIVSTPEFSELIQWDRLDEKYKGFKGSL